ncbi:MAG: pyrroloquinoline quinone-dependent dehydrogenase [Gammaproteobacteria bacterium]|nr:pyrroloquinoline quinone-dependent dehydrogenase [Gammaproteobacteria bacterium]MCP4089222.1 pyrroloquinoline quinone-dependent dehydrogenase [Gammaproteobacteria bacterium]MCP4276754.1 pyrroloquinoline quinone-dependent dehydrogenase [Gammaproteobacteria bacterium]MCP4830597.1 pyrroloquinoline quinone-dependent dehydrogenase [Gammaproteobacteria bacterium]MCP4928406.1 pyrroloquinoline quinone-dependent dehydrogenase [Gammaproteobacteria bacterium]
MLRLPLALCSAILLVLLCSGSTAFASDWPVYGGDAGGRHYSSLESIDRDNVDELELAWSFRHGELENLDTPHMFASWHVTPILLPEAAGQSLVICTPFNRIIALDPTTGEERWVFDPEVGESSEWTRHNCRGVAYWQDNETTENTVCKYRIFAGTETMRVMAVDALTGKACTDFGEAGQVNVDVLTREKTPDLKRGDMQFASPPAIIGDLVIMGSSDNTKATQANNPSGAVRAFDARTGVLRWSFDPIPRNDNDPAAEGWTADALEQTGGANVWSMISVDASLDLVYLPTASAGPQYYGGDRPGDNRYANSVVAVRGSTGEVVWHYQVLHHDVWDLDIPAQPMLFDLELDGEAVPALLQLTKQGLTFVFNRETGEPLFEIVERPVPQGGVPGEVLSPTQPFPINPPPLGQIEVSPEDAWGFTIFDRTVCRDRIGSMRHGSIYTPPSEQGTVMLPGLSVTNWGGAAWDPDSQNLIVPINRAPLFIRLLPVSGLSEDELNSPMAGKPFGPPGRIEGTDFAVQFGPVLSPLMSPCTKPPWGELLSLNVATGKINWRRTLGVLDGLSPLPFPLEWGTPMSGGPVVTAGGLIFLGATADERFRALDVDTGEILWETRTPTSSMATPMTYEIDGRQYVVVASGGHTWLYGRRVDDYLVAYALPEALE